MAQVPAQFGPKLKNYWLVQALIAAKLKAPKLQLEFYSWAHHYNKFYNLAIQRLDFKFLTRILKIMVTWRNEPDGNIAKD